MTLSMIGLDTAKSALQLHGVDPGGKVVLRAKLQRGELVAFFQRQPHCTVVMEACGAVRPFVKRGKKNDAADAAAICTAAMRPDARFVVVKSAEQQAVLALHSARTLLAKQQTMLVINPALIGLTTRRSGTAGVGRWSGSVPGAWRGYACG